MKIEELDSITRTASAALVIMVVSFGKGTKAKRIKNEKLKMKD